MLFVPAEPVLAAALEAARELLELGRTLCERLGTVACHLAALGTALRRSVTAYNRAVGSMETRLLVTARSLSPSRWRTGTTHPASSDRRHCSGA